MQIKSYLEKFKIRQGRLTIQSKSQYMPLAKIRIFFVSLFLISISESAFSQDPVFSQFYAAGLYLNPALAGAEKDITFSTNYRSQWKNVVTPYTTNQFSFIYPFVSHGIKNSHKGGFGVSYFNDRAGDGNFKTNGLNASFAYNLSLSYTGLHYLSFGLQAGFVQRTVDFTNLQWGSQYNQYVGFDPSVPVNENQVTNTNLYPDISAGMVLSINGLKNYSKRNASSYLGLAVYHLNRPNESMVVDKVARVPMLFKFHGGVEWKVGEYSFLSPNFIALYQAGNYQINAGLNFNFRMLAPKENVFPGASLILGVYYRVQNSFIWTVGIHNEAFTFGFSYDMNNLSNLQFGQVVGNNTAAYELSFAVRMFKKHKIDRFATPRI